MRPTKDARLKLTQRLELLSLFFALLVVLLITILGYRAWAAFDRQSEQFEIAQQVLAETETLLSAIKDAESGQRGFLLTGREEYLLPYQQAIAEIPLALNRLTLATIPRPDQSGRVEILRPLVEEKLSELKQTVELRRSQGADAALALVLSNRGREAMQEIRRQCAEIKTVAYGRLVRQAGETQANANQMGLVSSVGGVSLFALLLFSVITMRRGARRRQELVDELQSSERETREARDWLQTTIASIGDAVIATDAAGKVILMNSVAESLTGWTLADSAGKPLEEIFIIHHEETGVAAENPVTKALREGVIVGLANHTELTSRSGSRVAIDDSAAPVRDAFGKTTGVVVVFRDITARKEAEDALRRSLEFDEAVLKNMGEGLYTVDAQGLVTSMNPAAEKLFGASFEELRGRKMEGALLPPDEGMVGYEDVFIRKDGTPMDVICSFTPLTTGSEATGKIVVFRDVTERNQLEKALRSSERSYRAIGEAINYGVWICTPDGRNTYASDSFLRLVGITQEECSDFGWAGILHPDDADRTVAEWKECARAGVMWNIEHRFRGVDGQYHWVLARGVPMRDERGEIICWVGINLDIDQLKSSEESLRASERELLAANHALLRANEDLNQFAFAASHDLQEPLRMITNFSQLLVKSYRGQLEEDAELYTNFITDGTKRMRDLLADLLAYTQVAADDREVANAVDLNGTFEKVLENCRISIDHSQAVVTRDRLPTVLGYEPHFLQLLQNLVANAIKYRGRQPLRVHVSAAPSDNGWLLTVADNGIGIDPQYHNRIFGVFKRLHGKEIPGTGVGLAICQRVVHRYGGRIWVESQLDRGATFYCSLPELKGGFVAGRSV